MLKVNKCLCNYYMIGMLYVNAPDESVNLEMSYFDISMNFDDMHKVDHAFKMSMF